MVGALLALERAQALEGDPENLARLYEAVPRIWQEWAFSDRVDTLLRPPVHGDNLIRRACLRYQ